MRKTFSAIILLSYCAVAGEVDCTVVPPNPCDSRAHKFYCLPQGEDIIPLWLLKVLPGKNTKRFIDMDNLKRFGFLPNPDCPKPESCDSPAIGLTSNKGKFGLENLGLNCAACHVSQLIVDGKRTSLLDGAPNMIDAEQFLKAIRDAAMDENSLKAVAENLVKEKLAAKNLLKPKAAIEVLRTAWTEVFESKTEPSASMELPSFIGSLDELRKFLAFHAGRINYFLTLESIQKEKGVERAGPGRVDDFGGARDIIWALDRVDLNGPSSILDLWNFQGKEWLHWDLNMNSTFDRNLGQTISGGALYKPGGITVLVPNIYALESMAFKMQAPKWPGKKKIDEAKRAQGEKLFEVRCAKCHEAEEQRVHSVGTDENRWKTYRQDIRRTEGGPKVPFQEVGPKGLLDIKADVLKAANCTEKSQEAVDREGAKAEWRAHKEESGKCKNCGYVARPLKGIWASAPYLHNGSVLTLFELLQPASRQLGMKFKLGHREYDSEKVGFKYFECAAGEVGCFDTSKPGNSNQGHDFDFIKQFTDDQRWDIVEYLKTR